MHCKSQDFFFLFSFMSTTFIQILLEFTYVIVSLELFPVQQNGTDDDEVMLNVLRCQLTY